MPPRLSKSRFLSGQQCDLRLWYEVHARELATPPDAAAEAIFATGHEVGALARKRFPGGILVEEDHLHGRDADLPTACSFTLVRIRRVLAARVAASA